MTHAPSSLVGVGLYTPAEAGHLLQIAPGKITRWLRGHQVKGSRYEALWQPLIDLGDEGIFLGFRDLMEVRVAAAFIRKGLTPQRVRRAIVLAREIINDERPLSTTRFRTDGLSVFLQVAEEDGSAKLIDLFERQYAFREVIEQSLKNIEFDQDGTPAKWWPLGRAASVVIDPARSFGAPIEQESAVPAEILAAAATAEGSLQKAARTWQVPVRAVRHAVAFQAELSRRNAA